MATVLITGGTGLIGAALTKELRRKGYRVIILTRKKKTNEADAKEWNVDEGRIDEEAVREADYIVHLAGANVAEDRWTAKRKKEIVDSRVRSGELLVKALAEIPNGVKALISASAIGWYGPDPSIPNPKPFVESDKAHNDFLGQTCVKWEAAIEPVVQLNKRLVILRTGIVLSNEGGAYAEFKKPLKFGLASILGSGKQVVSWIHIDDLVAQYIAAIENESYVGIYNSVAPQPVSNKKLILDIAKQRNKFYLPVPVPAVALKIALGEMSVEVLKSATVSAERIIVAGYRFLYPDIADAVKNLESKTER